MNDWITQQGSLALGSRFRRLSDYLNSEIRGVYKDLAIDFNPRHFPTLSLLYEEDPKGLSISEMSIALNVSHVLVSKTIKELEEKEFCKRTQNKKDERVFLITITPNAKKIIDSELIHIWKATKSVVAKRVGNLNGDFWSIIEESEEKLKRYSLKDEILLEMKKKSSS